MKALRSITAAFAFALSTGCALAAPALKADITVDAPVVTVGDMFDDAGTLAEQPLFRSPLPGTTGNVEVATIRTAAQRVGLTDFEVNGLASVRVSRSATMVDETLLTDLIVNDLRTRGILGKDMSARLVFAHPVPQTKVETSDAPATLSSLRYLPGNGSFSASFRLAGLDQTLDISGNVEISIEAPHLAAALPAGAVLRPEDIVMRPVPLQQVDAQGIATMGQLVGMALNRQSREGLALRASDVSTPLAVSKNDLVTIYYRQGPMTLTVKGQAVTGAAQGAPLQVLNLISRRVISANAIAPGAVEVTSAPVALAGL